MTQLKADLERFFNAQDMDESVRQKSEENRSPSKAALQENILITLQQEIAEESKE